MQMAGVFCFSSSRPRIHFSVHLGQPVALTHSPSICLCWQFSYNRKIVSAMAGQLDHRLCVDCFSWLLTPMINNKRALKDREIRGPA